MEKKIRFGDLVRNSGRPQAFTLWIDPQKDRAFSRAVKENRIVTVVQDPTSMRKDSGEIGFRERAHAFYLVFPRPLPKLEAARVIGINYTLLEEPKATDAAPKAKPTRKAPEVKPEPVRKQFRVKIRRTATLEIELDVTAIDRSEAERMAIDRAKNQKFQPAKTEINNEVIND